MAVQLDVDDDKWRSRWWLYSLRWTMVSEGLVGGCTASAFCTQN